MDIQNLFRKVYTHLFAGLLLTFAIAYYVSMNPNMIYNLFSGTSWLILVVAQIGVVFYLSARIHKMSLQSARICFYLYSFLTGLTFSTIFLVYEVTSIVYVFALTAAIFFILAFVAPKLKIDITKMGNMLFVTLVIVLIASIVNMFVGSESFDLGLTSIGVFLFMGYIVYDIKKIHENANRGLEIEKAAIYSAFELYIDFINLFIRLLKLFGDRN
ncbi:MAG: Bax inhibitor-1/YccA family protein [Mycoplasmatota bacterium]